MRLSHLLLFLGMFMLPLCGVAHKSPNWSAYSRDVDSLESVLIMLAQEPDLDSDSLIYLLKDGYAYFLNEANVEGQASVLYHLGLVYVRESMLSASLDVHEQTLEIFREIGALKKEGQVLTVMGTTYGRRGDYDRATSHLLEALKIFEQLDERRGVADVLLKLGTVQSYLSQKDAALKYFFDALEISETHLRANVTTLYGNIGYIYLEKGDFDQSETYFRKALDHDGGTGSLRPQALALLNLGQMYKLKGDPAQADLYLNQALQLAEEGNMLEEQVAISLIMVDESSRAGQLRSLENLHALNTRAGEMEMRYMQLEILNKMISLSNQLGMFEETIELMENRDEMESQLFNESKQRDIANLHASYEMDRFKQENLRLSEKVSAEERRLVLVFLSLIVLSVGFFVAVYFFIRAQRANKLLKEREKELSQSNQVKDKLFSIIGHDLKNAISTQPMVLELIKEAERDTPEYRTLWGGLEASVNEVLFVLDTLLNWGIMQIQGVSSQPVSFQVGDVMENAVRLMQLSASLKNVRIINKIPADYQVLADKNQFRFVIRNLLGNALKYSLEGGQIEIGLKTMNDSEEHAFYVKDYGVGIDASVLESIFDSNQESSLGTSNELGHGIALALSRQFIEKHDGRIWVESEIDKGSTFYFTCGHGK